MVHSDRLSSPAFKQFTKGYSQTLLARLSTAREAVVWAWQGADNLVSALLEVRGVSFNKKSHKDKWEKFVSAYPEFLRRAPPDQIERCRKMWEDARYRDREISAEDAGQVTSLATEVFEFGIRVLEQLWGISARKLRQGASDASERELAVVAVKEVEDYLRACEANAEQEAIRWGFAPYTTMLGDPATYTHFWIQTDEPDVKRLIETETDIAERITEACKSFVEAVTKIALKRLSHEAFQMLAAEEKLSEEQAFKLLKSLANALEFNLLLRSSFLGYNFLENVEHVRDVVKAIREGRLEFINPEVVREASPRIVEYEARIQKEPGA